MAVIRVELMLNWMCCYTSANGYGPAIIMALEQQKETGPLTKEECNHLYNMLLIPTRYRNVSKEKQKVYVEQIIKNKSACNRFEINCKQVEDRLDLLCDNIRYGNRKADFWAAHFTLGLNIMGSIVYQMIVYDISYRLAIVNTINNVYNAGVCDAIDLLFLKDFFNDYFWLVLPNDALLTPYNALKEHRNILCKEQTYSICTNSDSAITLDIRTGIETNTYVPWVSDNAHIKIKGSVKTAASKSVKAGVSSTAHNKSKT